MDFTPKPNEPQSAEENSQNLWANVTVEKLANLDEDVENTLLQIREIDNDFTTNLVKLIESSKLPSETVNTLFENVQFRLREIDTAELAEEEELLETEEEVKDEEIELPVEQAERNITLPKALGSQGIRMSTVSNLFSKANSPKAVVPVVSNKSGKVPMGDMGEKLNLKVPEEKKRILSVVKKPLSKLNISLNSNIDEEGENNVGKQPIKKAAIASDFKRTLPKAPLRAKQPFMERKKEVPLEGEEETAPLPSNPHVSPSGNNMPPKDGGNDDPYKGGNDISKKTQSSAARNAATAMSNAQRIQRILTSEAVQKNTANGSNKVDVNFEVCRKFVKKYNEEIVISKKGPTNIMLAIKPISDLKLKITEKGIMDARSPIAAGDYFVTNAKDAINMIRKGLANDVTRTRLHIATEVADAKMVGVNTIVRDKFGGWNVSRVKLGDNLLAGAKKTLSRMRGDTKLGIKTYTEADIVASSNIVVPFGADAFDFQVLFNVSIMAQRGQLNNYIINELARNFNPNWVIYLALADPKEFLKLEDYTPAKLRVVLAFLLSKTSVSRFHPDFRLITRRTEYLASEDQDVKERQMRNAELIKKNYQLIGVGDTTSMDDVNNERKKRNNKGPRFNV
jgi:hypothetical protein